MADEVRGESFEGREPYRQTPPEPRVYWLGDHERLPGQAPSRSDDDIRRDVETALFYDDAVSSLGIQVSVQGGIVTLNGTASSDLAKHLAGEDAWKVGGVRDVKNELQVHESPTPSRAAGQDMVSTKPPAAINGEPPAEDLAKHNQPLANQPGQSMGRD